MCGILGVTGNHVAVIEKARKRLAYRGPDAGAIVTRDAVTLGHARLAIIDLDSRATQPLVETEERVAIVFNGEIYNFKELREELREKHGCVFRTTSDTEVLLLAYGVWGEAMIDRLNGMYTFVIHDRVAKRLWLVSDQAAIKPLFYAHWGEGFAFASSIAALIEILRGVNTAVAVDPEMLQLYFALGYVPAPKTLFSGIQRLPPRTCVTYNLTTKTITTRTYELPSSKVHTVDDLQKVLEASVESHLVADVPIGLFFSGGTDSSLIAAMLEKHHHQLKAYCVHIEGRPEDAQYADKIAKELGLASTTSVFGPQEFEAVYDEVVARIDEPFADSSLFPTYFVAKQAAREVKVVLSGEGGDEFFFGYPRSLQLALMRHAPLDRETGILERLFFMLPPVRGKHKLFEWLFEVARRPLAFYLLTMSPTKSLMTFPMWRETKSYLAALVTRSSDFDARLYLPNVLLRKTDLATMFASIEGRVPLLGKEVMAAAQTLPQTITRATGLKPVLRTLLRRYLPAELVDRKKTGFGLRTGLFYLESPKLQRDLHKALAYVGTLDVSVQFPSETVLLKKYPNTCWQLVFLYHALRNTKTL